MRTKKKTVNRSKTMPIAPQPSGFVVNFRAMPALLKLLFILSAFSVYTSLSDIAYQTPVEFGYFGSAFPASVPMLWHFFSLLMNGAAVAVYLKRSYSLLRYYLNVNLAILGITALNSVYDVWNLPESERLLAGIIYVTSFGIGLALYFYQLKQREYFNRP